MAHDVFISYSVKDKAIAEQVCSSLEGERIECWIAPRNITPGSVWSESIVEAITDSKVLVILFSANSNESDDVLREVAIAGDKDVPIIPFRIDEVLPSESLDYYLSSVHWLDASTPPVENHLATLINTVKGLLAEKSSEAEVVVRRPSARQRARANWQAVPKKKFYIIAGAALIAALTAVVMLNSKANLIVSAAPSTEVYIDGVRVGATDHNGRFTKSGIKTGEHEIKLVNEAFEVHTERRDFKLLQSVEIATELLPLSVEEFSDEFNNDLYKWTLPAPGWGIQSQTQKVDNRLVGNKFLSLHKASLSYPKDTRFGNFKMRFRLVLTNGMGAAWALRIKDASNYYLFHLYNPPGDEEPQFRTYKVRDGSFNEANPINPVSLPLELNRGGEYDINISAQDNVIEHVITSNDTGRKYIFAEFIDKENIFPYGNIGFRTIRDEQFAIDSLYVKPSQVKLP